MSLAMSKTGPPIRPDRRSANNRFHSESESHKIKKAIIQAARIDENKPETPTRMNTSSNVGESMIHDVKITKNDITTPVL
jgi:hypothetical protein